MTSVRLLIAAVLVAGLPLPAAETTEHVIDQKNREFSQTEITIKPGDKIVFQNSDTVTHNVFSNSKVNPFNIKVQTPGNSSTVAFMDEGVTEVRCAIHPKMKLMVTVKK
ncbi:MAG TPA: plastocyanin/azurin family copper-binding protein [Methylomirabilota bacterium]|nr:plastocyanin/azurin family copper-binding protein [Methylomirabilota bacterium]